MTKEEPYWHQCRRKYGHTEGEILTAFGYQPQAVYEDRLRVELCKTEEAFKYLQGMLEVMQHTGVYENKGLKLEFNYEPSFPAALVVVQDYPPCEEQPRNDKTECIPAKGKAQGGKQMTRNELYNRILTVLKEAACEGMPIGTLKAVLGEVDFAIESQINNLPFGAISDGLKERMPRE